jgi:predicted lipid-binding transport protein (Tim44 family)
MRHTGLFFAFLLAASLALSPTLVDAAAGSGTSSGSRGSRTYSAPPPTATAPSTAAPMQRSATPQATPYRAPGLAPAPAAGGFFGRSPFMSGLMGGIIGAGIGGMLFGGGFFHGISGFGGFLGFLIQVAIVVLIVRWLFRRFFRPAMAGGPEMMDRTAMGGMPGGSAPAAPPVAIGPADYAAFEQILQGVQTAWSAQDIHGLQNFATPEMVGYFNEQLSEMASRGVRNTVTAVHLEQGDLSEAWAETGREYATVAMRFSMIDATYDSTGRVVQGNANARTQSTEVWTFLRSPGGRWILSAIQQTQ